MGALAGPGWLTLALAGGALGAMAGLVPGLHPNTLATGLLLVVLAGYLPGPETVPLLLGLLGAWTFASILPLVILGVPEGADAPALLPGQRLARKGLARQALEASARGSLVGLAAGSLLALGLAGALAHAPLAQALTTATPWIQGAALIVLVASDPAGPLRAGLVAGLAGALGLGALELAVTSPVGLPASPLGPLFIGLFGVPALAQAARAGPITERVPVLSPPRSRPPKARAGLLGASLGLVAGTVSGFTSGPATAIAVLVRRSRDEEVLATASAVNTATACVATAALHGLGRTRTGVHAAQLTLAPPAPGLDAIAGDLAALAAGGVVGMVWLWAGSRATEHLAEAIGQLAAGLIVVWVVMVGLLTGLGGFLIAASGWAVAQTAARAGARRSVLMACLLVPGLVDTLGLGISA